LRSMWTRNWVGARRCISCKIARAEAEGEYENHRRRSIYVRYLVTVRLTRYRLCF
jgi:Zn ribbon nucleic-acid-binding protein